MKKQDAYEKPKLSFGGNHRNKRTAGIPLAFESHRTVYQGEQRVVFSHAYIRARMIFGAALTDNDIAGGYGLSAKDFNAQAFAF